MSDTIAAVATGQGGAIAVIRVSGEAAVSACEGLVSRDLVTAGVYYGRIKGVDDVVATVFRAPRSYTGEDVVEISCHGSRYIQQQILQLLISQGVRLASAGEFTMRALMNGKLDLAQAEAVADLIAAEDRASHDVAQKQLRGGFSEELQLLRADLVRLASLLELELDFGEEDVEFADRGELGAILDATLNKIERLRSSFAAGNAMKNGIAVAIVGRPNVGKSTLLNALLGDDRAIVSDVAGTTRDTLEESVVIDGVRFRFVDTAGLRETVDPLERLGINRTRAAIERANVILNVTEADFEPLDVVPKEGQRMCVVVNKADLAPVPDNCHSEEREARRGIPLPVRTAYRLKVSALHDTGLDALRAWLTAGITHDDGIVVSSARHHEALTHAAEALTRARTSLQSGLTPDLLAQDTREALHHLGLITGEVTTDDLLTTIFSKFCIGK